MLHTRPETFGRKHSSVAHRRQIISQFKAHSVTGSGHRVKNVWVGSGRVTGHRLGPGSISVRGVLWAPPAGFDAEPRPPKGFPLFSALRMASPDTNVWTIVQPLGGGGKTPVPLPCVSHGSAANFKSLFMDGDTRYVWHIQLQRLYLYRNIWF